MWGYSDNLCFKSQTLQSLKWKRKQIIALAVTIKKVVSDLLYAGSTMVESQCIFLYQEKNKVIGIAQYLTIASRPLHMQYRRTFRSTRGEWGEKKQGRVVIEGISKLS